MRFRTQLPLAVGCVALLLALVAPPADLSRTTHVPVGTDPRAAASEAQPRLPAVVCRATPCEPPRAATALGSTDAPWTLLSPVLRPPPLSGAVMVYDAADGYYVLFGGGTGTVSGAATYHPVNYTWAFDPTSQSWSNLTATVAPPPSDQWAMAYDAADGYAVLFGDGTNETWTFSHGSWTEIAPTMSPPSRFLPCMAYDPGDRYIVLYGGESIATSAALSDTWSFSGGTWTNRSSSIAPPAGYGCSLVDDPSLGGLVEFGGWTNPTPSSILENQTWTYVHGGWTNVTRPTAPPARYGADASYVPGCGCVVLFGGFFFYSGSGGPGEGTLGDNWILFRENWTRVSPSTIPSMSATGAMAFAPNDPLAVLYGGFDYSGLSGSTWTFSDPLDVGFSATTPTTVDVGALPQFSVVTNGGVAPISLAWSGLPPGCVEVGVGAESCRISSPGTWNVTVSATDAGGYPASASSLLTAVTGLTVAVSLSENATDVGHPIWVNATSVGGVGTPVFAWHDVPSGMGCPSLNGSTDVATARCTPTIAGEYTLAVAGTDTTGYTASSTARTVVVNPAPNVSATVLPSPVPPGTNGTISIVISGGTAPFSIHFVGLPAGCGSANVTSLSCNFPTIGIVRVIATVVDAVGSTSSGEVNVTVATPSSSSAVAVLGSPVVLVGVAVGAALVLVAVALVVRARRRR